ncbi:hypothetical protein Glove_120g142 [Diversispora epigaea]|uniref:Uncharacterized protein n=1 Tax=Diversispora epigaea TaxID=1348612 RepID=A0A397J8Z1_9GLOM|nr:hypothetical protein Glove_120g142 [Diversispora epigaea]
MTPGLHLNSPDGSYVPLRLLNPGLILNPWKPTANQLSLKFLLRKHSNKIDNHWLAPNRCEDVIVIKIGTWEDTCRDQNRSA